MTNRTGYITDVKVAPMIEAYKMLREHAPNGATFCVTARDFGDKFQIVVEAHSPCDKEDHTNCFVVGEMQDTQIFDDEEKARVYGTKLGESLAMFEGANPRYPDTKPVESKDMN